LIGALSQESTEASNLSLRHGAVYFSAGSAGETNPELFCNVVTGSMNASIWGGSVRVLVIEDEVKLAELARRSLEEEGYRTEVALDGDTGLALASSEDFDLIILDWLLPKRDGRLVCETLRALGNKAPILMLTARASVDDRIAGLDAGADDYLTKPFAFGELLARSRALLRRGQSGASPYLTIADLVLNPATRRVRRGSREIILTVREFALLEVLLRYSGKVVTRSMIIERVWNVDFEGDSNVVDVYINYLRNKVDRGHSVKLIHTVRGVGYRLDATK